MQSRLFGFCLFTGATLFHSAVSTAQAHWKQSPPTLSPNTAAYMNAVQQLTA